MATFLAPMMTKMIINTMIDRGQAVHARFSRATIARLILTNKVLNGLETDDALVYVDLCRSQWTEDDLVRLVRQLTASIRSVCASCTSVRWTDLVLNDLLRSVDNRNL